jgi:hypothetical protein
LGKGKLAALRWTPGVVLGSMHVIANSLFTNVGVGSCPQMPPDAVCSGCSCCLSQSCDPTISSCCRLLWPSSSRPVFHSSSGLVALQQSCYDGRRHLRPSDNLAHANAILEPPHGSSSVQQAQFQSSNHHVVLPWRTQAVVFSELPVDDVNSQGFNVSPAVHHFVRNSMWKKMLRQQKMVTFFNF